VRPDPPLSDDGPGLATSTKARAVPMTNLGDKGRGMGRFSGGVCPGGPVCSARMAHLALVAPVVRLALVAPVARFPLVVRPNPLAPVDLLPLLDPSAPVDLLAPLFPGVRSFAP
jgi:hypothetical protein